MFHAKNVVLVTPLI